MSDIDTSELAKVLHDHSPEPHLPPLLISGCKCGWGSEVFSHTAHQATVVSKWLQGLPALLDAADERDAAIRQARADALREAASDVGAALVNEIGSGHTSTYSVRRWLNDRADLEVTP